MMTIPKPRDDFFMGMKIPNWYMSEGTWLEGEEFTYPKGGWNRKAYAKCEDGALRLFTCTIADTFFSIPARGKIRERKVKRFLSVNDSQVLHFTETEK